MHSATTHSVAVYSATMHSAIAYSVNALCHERTYHQASCEMIVRPIFGLALLSIAVDNSRVQRYVRLVY